MAEVGNTSTSETGDSGRTTCSAQDGVSLPSGGARGLPLKYLHRLLAGKMRIGVENKLYTIPKFNIVLHELPKTAEEEQDEKPKTSRKRRRKQSEESTSESSEETSSSLETEDEEDSDLAWSSESFIEEDDHVFNNSGDESEESVSIGRQRAARIQTRSCNKRRGLKNCGARTRSKQLQARVSKRKRIMSSSDDEQDDESETPTSDSSCPAKNVISPAQRKKLARKQKLLTRRFIKRHNIVLPDDQMEHIGRSDSDDDDEDYSIGDSKEWFEKRRPPKPKQEKQPTKQSQKRKSKSRSKTVTFSDPLELPPELTVEPKDSPENLEAELDEPPILKVETNLPSTSKEILDRVQRSKTPAVISSTNEETGAVETVSVSSTEVSGAEQTIPIAETAVLTPEAAVETIAASPDSTTGQAGRPQPVLVSEQMTAANPGPATVTSTPAEIPAATTDLPATSVASALEMSRIGAETPVSVSPAATPLKSEVIVASIPLKDVTIERITASTAPATPVSALQSQTTTETPPVQIQMVPVSSQNMPQLSDTSITAVDFDVPSLQSTDFGEHSIDRQLPPPPPPSPPPQIIAEVRGKICPICFKSVRCQLLEAHGRTWHLRRDLAPFSYLCHLCPGEEMFQTFGTLVDHCQLSHRGSYPTNQNTNGDQVQAGSGGFNKRAFRDHLLSVVASGETGVLQNGLDLGFVRGRGRPRNNWEELAVQGMTSPSANSNSTQGQGQVGSGGTISANVILSYIVKVQLCESLKHLQFPTQQLTTEMKLVFMNEVPEAISRILKLNGGETVPVHVAKLRLKLLRREVHAIVDKVVTAQRMRWRERNANGAGTTDSPAAAYAQQPQMAGQTPGPAQHSPSTGLAPGPAQHSPSTGPAPGAAQHFPLSGPAPGSAQHFPLPGPGGATLRAQQPVQHHQPTIGCPYCPFQSYNMDLLEKHAQANHCITPGFSSGARRGFLPCNVSHCDILFDNLTQFSQHHRAGLHSSRTQGQFRVGNFSNQAPAFPIPRPRCNKRKSTTSTDMPAACYGGAPISQPNSAGVIIPPLYFNQAVYNSLARNTSAMVSNRPSAPSNQVYNNGPVSSMPHPSNTAWMTQRFPNNTAPMAPYNRPTSTVPAPTQPTSSIVAALNNHRYQLPPNNHAPPAIGSNNYAVSSAQPFNPVPAPTMPSNSTASTAPPVSITDLLAMPLDQAMKRAAALGHSGVSLTPTAEQRSNYQLSNSNSAVPWINPAQQTVRAPEVIQPIAQPAVHAPTGTLPTGPVIVPMQNMDLPISVSTTHPMNVSTAGRREPLTFHSMEQQNTSHVRPGSGENVAVEDDPDFECFVCANCSEEFATEQEASEHLVTAHGAEKLHYFQ